MYKMNLIATIKKYLKIYIFQRKVEFKTNKKKAFIMMSANYGNLGDVAITYAQEAFIRKNLSDYEIVNIPIDKVYSTVRYIKKHISEDDIITIIGGGNTGDKYIAFEERRRYIVKYFKDNKIICFPQTIDFSDTKSGKKELEKSIKDYSKNRNLYIFAREKKSYETYKKYFKDNNIYCVPDIVLSLDKSEQKKSRDKFEVLLTLRNDKEKVMDSNSEKDMIKAIKQKYNKIQFRDTHIGNEIKEKEKLYIELKNIWNDFKCSKIVITDRLHGMIFCAITATPCIVLPNSNHKIKESYKNWLSDVDYINFMDNINKEKILEIIDKYINTQNIFHVKNLETKYEQLEKILKNR